MEIFFRFFKQTLGCRHLLSRKRKGIEIQAYCAIIACMLISLWTGAKPNRATMEMLHWNYTGMASDRELEEHIRGLKKEKA